MERHDGEPLQVTVRTLHHPSTFGEEKLVTRLLGEVSLVARPRGSGVLAVTAGPLLPSPPREVSGPFRACRRELFRPLSHDDALFVCFILLARNWPGQPGVIVRRAKWVTGSVRARTLDLLLLIRPLKFDVVRDEFRKYSVIKRKLEGGFSLLLKLQM